MCVSFFIRLFLSFGLLDSCVGDTVGMVALFSPFFGTFCHVLYLLSPSRLGGLYGVYTFRGAVVVRL